MSTMNMSSEYGEIRIGTKETILQLNMDAIGDSPVNPAATSLGKSPRPPDLLSDPIAMRSLSSSSSVISGTESKGSAATMESPTKKQKKAAQPRPHCVICHVDYGLKNKTCIVQHEFYEDTDCLHKKELGCIMVYCAYCSYKGCSKNCDEFKNQPKACYIGKHITKRSEAQQEHLEFHQDCTICYPDQVDVLDFVMSKVVFGNKKYCDPVKETKKNSKGATQTKTTTKLIPKDLQPATARTAAQAVTLVPPQNLPLAAPQMLPLGVKTKIVPPSVPLVVAPQTTSQPAAPTVHLVAPQAASVTATKSANLAAPNNPTAGVQSTSLQSTNQTPL